MVSLYCYYLFMVSLLFLYGIIILSLHSVHSAVHFSVTTAGYIQTYICSVVCLYTVRIGHDYLLILLPPSLELYPESDGSMFLLDRHCTDLRG
jgi:hypothetical protein